MGADWVKMYHLPHVGESIFLKPFPSEDDDWVLMQFTGLKDKNGRDIYEGDIVQVGDEPCYYDVKWRVSGYIVERKLHPDLGDPDHGWQFSDLADLESFNGDDTLTDVVIVGNVHENPKLFKTA